MKPPRPLPAPWNDLAVAVSAAPLLVLGAWLAPRGTGLEQDLDLWGYLLIIVPALLMAFRRGFPVPVAVISVVCALAYYGLTYPGIFAAAPALVSIYTLVAMGRRAFATVLGVVLPGGMLVISGVLGEGWPPPLDGPAWLLGWIVALAVLGETVRQRRAYLDETERRAVQAEQTRESEARHRANEERLRIARELHDALTHKISVINVQAAVSLRLARQRPEQALEALAVIKEAGQDAMRELRSTLGVLRSTDEAARGGSGLPSLSRLNELVVSAGQLGLPVQVAVSGRPRSLPEEVDAAAYRIVQESLTNVARHAGRATVTIQVRYDLETLSLDVSDDGGGTPPSQEFAEGVGMRGMRERVLALNGSLDAGPREDGGFRVTATLPLDEGPSGSADTTRVGSTSG